MHALHAIFFFNNLTNYLYFYNKSVIVLATNLFLLAQSNCVSVREKENSTDTI